MKRTLILVLSLVALLASACGDDDKCTAEPDGWVCLAILDQWDTLMTDCDLTYDLPAGTDVYEGHASCPEGQWLVFGQPGNYRIDAECGDRLVGYVEVPVEANPTPEDQNEFYDSRLVDSLCYNAITLGPDDDEVSLSPWLGYSTATHCEYGLNYEETYWMGIESISDPSYLEATGEFGIVSGGHPTSLNVRARSDRVPAGEEVTVLVRVRELSPEDEPSPLEQGIDLPVVIRGPEAESATP
ncbi:hypothetical protein JXD20_04680 [Candidatus Peregrinibacteria bacterium]|nr:hypothetical protein [Candidatus Peregrinibacteria bacterium]